MICLAFCCAVVFYLHLARFLLITLCSPCAGLKYCDVQFNALFDDHVCEDGCTMGGFGGGGGGNSFKSEHVFALMQLYLFPDKIIVL